MATLRTRRQPPPFCTVEVAEAAPRSPFLTRVTLTGHEFAGFDPGLPAASVRVLLPGIAGNLVIPTWQRNEFLFDDGSRPVIRTVTPLRFDPDLLTLDIEIVRHARGPLTEWADTAAPGDRVAISGTGRGYTIDPEARTYLLAGDESAFPAISMLLRSLPQHVAINVVIEARSSEAEVEFPNHPGASVRWIQAAPNAPPGDSLVTAVSDIQLDPDARVWAAAEAAAVYRIRQHLFDERDIDRSNAVVRGYWKVDRS